MYCTDDKKLFYWCLRRGQVPLPDVNSSVRTVCKSRFTESALRYSKRRIKSIASVRVRSVVSLPGNRFLPNNPVIFIVVIVFVNVCAMTIIAFDLEIISGSSHATKRFNSLNCIVLIVDISC